MYRLQEIIYTLKLDQLQNPDKYGTANREEGENKHSGENSGNANS